MDTNKKKIKEILQKPENRRTFNEKFELIDYKYQQKQKIAYEEFVLLSYIYDNVYFVYKNTEYQIDYGLPNITTFFAIEYDKNNRKISEKKENYSSGVELLNNVKIDNKQIREIWDETHFGVVPNNKK